MEGSGGCRVDTKKNRRHRGGMAVCCIEWEEVKLQSARFNKDFEDESKFFFPRTSRLTEREKNFDSSSKCLLKRAQSRLDKVTLDLSKKTYCVLGIYFRTEDCQLDKCFNNKVLYFLLLFMFQSMLDTPSPRLLKERGKRD